MERRANATEGRVDARVRFAAPTVAAAARPPALVFVALVAALAATCIVFVRADAVWPTPAPLATMFVFVAFVTLFNAFGAFQRYGEFASFVGLDGPLVIALLLLVDWKLYVVAVALDECAIFAVEALRKVNPTIWYLRVFNFCEYVVAGAAATLAIHVLWHPAAGQAPLSWDSPVLFAALLLGIVLWKAVDFAATHVTLALASGTPLWPVDIAPVQLAGEFAVLFAAVPLALLWTSNYWLAAFAFASIAGGSVLLHVSETEHRLHIDERTGLTNAAAFDHEFRGVLAEASRHRRSFALLLIDIDHFKTVNDSFGHDLGDRVIAWFADQLSAHARTTDLLARVGGEEFALLMHDTTLPEALVLGERLRATVAGTPYMVHDATPLRITTSVGIAIFPNDGIETRELFRAADAALYDAKRSGRNLVRTASAKPAP
jgi:diguanylate cyclase (GGDEF)-like protein